MFVDLLQVFCRNAPSLRADDLLARSIFIECEELRDLGGLAGASLAR